MPEPTELAGTVDGGGFDQRLRYGLKSSEKDDHLAADVPEAHDDEGWLGKVGIGQPAQLGDAEPAENGVENAKLGVVHVDEQHDEGHGGRHRRQVRERF